MKRTYFVVNGKVTEDNCNAVKEAFVASGATHIHLTDYTCKSSLKAVEMIFGEDECSFSWSKKAGCCGLEQMRELYGDDVIGEYTTDKLVKRNTKAPKCKEVITGAEIQSVLGDCNLAKHNWVWSEHYRCYVQEEDGKHCLSGRQKNYLLSLLTK